MERLERFYRIQSLLRSRRHVRTQDFLAELEVSRATFKRDLEYMKDRMHAPIVYDRHHEAYRFDDAVADSDVWQLPGLWFSAEELQSLLTMDSLIGALEPGVLAEAIAPLRRRLRELLQAGEHPAEEIARRIRIVAIGTRPVEPARFRVLSTAVLSRRRLRIRHERRSDGESLAREVSPQRLVHYRDNWYLDAWCHRREALRTFAVDAIAEAQLLEAGARDVADADLDRHYASGYGIFAGSDTQQARLRFTPQRARWVARERWHPEQHGEFEPDGSYVLTVPYSREPELVMDILKYGADVEVLAPAALRASVGQRLREAAARYCSA